MLSTHVLRSNAPPLDDGDGLDLTSRILQEHSGNRQHNAYPFPTGFEQKCPTSLLTENAYSRHHQWTGHHNDHQQLYYPRPHPRLALRHGYPRIGHPQCSPQEEAKNQVEAEFLYQRFRQSDAYVKYRGRQSKDDKGNEDQKWPDHLEKAFFRALVTWKPMGRRKILHKNKQRGRNELIADCIQELTGEERSRKQVSSHIQVLKPFVEQDKYIMKYLSKEDLCAPQRHGHASGWGGGRRMSGYPVSSVPHSARNAMPSQPRTNSYNIAKLKASPDVFEPLEFEMFIQRVYKDDQGKDLREPDRLHTYTRSGRSDVPPRDEDLYMDDWQRIARDFPLLTNLSGQGRLDCNIIAAEATLAFPAEAFKGALPGVELGIKFICSSRHPPPTSKNGSSSVFCKNTFYVNGAVATPVTDQEQNPETTELHFSQIENRQDLEAQSKFGSKFWARNLGQMANRLLSPSKDYSEEVAAQIKSINGIQEIFILNNGHPERLLVIHWSFRQSTKPEGAARWRRLILSSLAPQSSQLGAGVKHEEYPRVERQDSIFDGYSHYVDMSASRPQQQLPLPALQSPFEYDSGSGSALSSATWPGSASDGSVVGQNGHFDFNTDNSFDFNAGNINISYDHNFNFDNLDSSAFDFGTGTGDFAADPGLDDYSQAWADPTATASFDTQPNSAVDENTNFMLMPDFQPQTATYDHAYDAQYSQHSYHGVPESQSYHGTPHDQHSFDQQAFGVAGQEFKAEDALGALADASYLASGMGHKQADPF
ncbi:uncharacterized protein LTR77_004340 [Saxophila tyrrhenica]|uniref:TEA domain-containing protein n=1 Tax=Saxophila tyrrhenica TaxID=1690608 RepID=A0AAV9PCV9_9PEZI|nr:hypothetical protein LTR77_004340 [Saxophila tyrrhenica]